jgi:uncharacterized protein
MYLAALLIMPIVCVGEHGGVLRFTGTLPLNLQIGSGEALFYSLIFFVGAIGEELGWQGYAYPALRTRRSALEAAVLLGVVRALWHVIPFVQLGRSAGWIFWHCLSTVGLGVIIVWLFVNADDSVFIAVLFHAMINVAWALFPNAGSHDDPFIAFAILMLATGLIIALWEPHDEPKQGMPHGRIR